MARIRTIKPEFWTDGDVVQMTSWARLFFIGTWNFTMCDQGHVADDPVRLKLQILPQDDVDPFALIEELVRHGRLTRLVDEDGRRYLHVKRFTDHQKLEKRWQPRCPACNAGGLHEPEPLPTSPQLPEPLRTSPNLPETRASLVEAEATPDVTFRPPNSAPHPVTVDAESHLSETRGSLGEHAQTPRNTPQDRTGGEGTGQENVARDLDSPFRNARAADDLGPDVNRVARKLGSTLTHARKVCRDILDRSHGGAGVLADDPTGYILAAIDREPQRYIEVRDEPTYKARRPTGKPIDLGDDPFSLPA